MIADVCTLIWKEWKEIFLQRSNYRGGIISLALFIGVSGIFLPIQFKSEWLTSPIDLFIWIWFSIFLVLSMVTDAIAGERERHTLETLLASRLSDQAILLGKICASVIYGWSVAILSIFVGLLTVNVIDSQPGFQVYPLPIFLGGIVLSFLACVLMSALGVLVSLNAPTARSAYQRLSTVLVVLFLVPVLGINLLPASAQQSLQLFLVNFNLNKTILWAAIILLFLDSGLILAARVRFQREKLLLD